MSGQITAPTRWMREALRLADPESVVSVQEAIPDGYHVSLFCSGKPRPLGAILWHGYVQVARVEPAFYSVGAACMAVLAKAAVAA